MPRCVSSINHVAMPALPYDLYPDTPGSGGRMWEDDDGADSAPSLSEVISIRYLGPCRALDVRMRWSDDVMGNYERLQHRFALVCQVSSERSLEHDDVSAVPGDDLDDDDPAYQTDEFRMWSMKVRAASSGHVYRASIDHVPDLGFRRATRHLTWPARTPLPAGPSLHAHGRP